LRVKKVSKEQRRTEPQKEKNRRYKIRPHMARAEDDVSPPKRRGEVQ